MFQHEQYMQECLNLALKGLGNVAPNPMVGCVIVYNGNIIGKGYHQAFGEAHAEVNAINSVGTIHESSLPNSVLYVSLEPCSHFGKTPPCADLIIKHGIKRVVIGSIDPNPLVSGKGVEKLIKSGCDVTIGVLERECMELNKRYFTFHHEKRPYIILKWAQTADGFIDRIRTIDEKPEKITGQEADKLVHQWRSEEQAIMVGTNTVIMDNPQLTTRLVEGRSPIRITIDRKNRIPTDAKIFSNFASVIVLKESEIEAIVKELYNRNIQSVIVEGGRKLLNSFIESGMWDEARVFYSEIKIGKGIDAPHINLMAVNEVKVGNDILKEYKNTHQK